MAKAELDVTALVEETFEKHFGVTLDRLRELAEADKDGRLVVLPCSLGKKVWSGKWRDDLSECVYVCASSMLSDIERGNVIRYTRKAAEAALKAGDNR